VIATPILDIGSGPGPDIVLLHGVGPGPGTFHRTARDLAVDHRVVVVERPWDPDRPPTLPDQAAAVDATVAALDLEGCVVVGVSGGATLALALAIRHPERLGGIVLHEPLLGTQVPVLHQRFTDAAHRAATGDEATVAVVREVMGERTWNRSSSHLRASIAHAAARIRVEIATFAGFDPSAEDLVGLRSLPVLATVGATSDDARRAVAARLAELAGADVATLVRSGNAAQLDAPEAFAELVRSWAATVRGGVR
jgi:pimeloyl-ACP methyl ester carboxylesterase